MNQIVSHLHSQENNSPDACDLCVRMSGTFFNNVHPSSLTGVLISILIALYRTYESPFENPTSSGIKDALFVIKEEEE